MKTLYSIRKFGFFPEGARREITQIHGNIESQIQIT